MILKNFNDLQLLSKTEYVGELSEYQQEGNKSKGKRYTQYEQDDFNTVQNSLYKRALYGLKVYNEKELKTMHWDKKKRIKKVHTKAQVSINIMKQERVNQLTNFIFNLWFPECEITKTFLNLENDTDPKFINTLDLKSLGIQKQHIAKRFVDEGILPKDFYKRKQ